MQTAAPMEVASDDPTVLTGKFNVTKSGTYKINFRTTGNQLNPNPVIYDIIAIPDRPPTARFVRPDKPTITVPANVTVDLVMTGNDDHGVKDATLHVTMENEKLVSKNMLEGRPPQPEFKAIETLDLAKLRVKPGAKLNYWLTVRDNKEPSSNRVRDCAPAHRGRPSRFRRPTRKSWKRARKTTGNRPTPRRPRHRRGVNDG